MTRPVPFREFCCGVIGEVLLGGRDFRAVPKRRRASEHRQYHSLAFRQVGMRV